MGILGRSNRNPDPDTTVNKKNTTPGVRVNDEFRSEKNVKSRHRTLHAHDHGKNENGEKIYHFSFIICERRVCVIKGGVIPSARLATPPRTGRLGPTERWPLWRVGPGPDPPETMA